MPDTQLRRLINKAAETKPGPWASRPICPLCHTRIGVVRVRGEEGQGLKLICSPCCQTMLDQYGKGCRLIVYRLIEEAERVAGIIPQVDDEVQVAAALAYQAELESQTDESEEVPQVTTEVQPPLFAFA